MFGLSGGDSTTAMHVGLGAIGLFGYLVVSKAMSIGGGLLYFSSSLAKFVLSVVVGM